MSPVNLDRKHTNGHFRTVGTKLFAKGAHFLLDCEFPRSNFQIPSVLTLSDDGSATGFLEAASRIASQPHTVGIWGRVI